MNCGKRLAGLALLALLLPLLSGCGYGSKDRVPVEGEVTLDGKPVDGGVIVFIPVEQEGSKPHLIKVGAEIVNGRYSLAEGKGPCPGNYRVEIIWEKKLGKQQDTNSDLPSPKDSVKQVIPAKYHAQSTLTAEIKPASNTHNFALDSKGPTGATGSGNPLRD